MISLSRSLKLLAGLACLFVASAQINASVPIFAPADGAGVKGGVSNGTTFAIAVAGTAANVNNFPAAESPDHTVDGVGQKYLNFAKLNTGFIITPGAGASVADSIKFWTANDAVERDPASYSLLGTNSAGSTTLADYTVISSGALTLPATRNGGGATALSDANSQTVTFSNSSSYTGYMVLFPTVKNAAAANSMQIGEVQLFGTVPEPTSLGLIGLGALGLLRRRRA